MEQTMRRRTFRGMTDGPPGDEDEEEGGWLTVVLVTLAIVLVGILLLFVEVQH